MISWIQKYFHRHFRLVFAVILIAVALPMVIVYSQSSSSLGRAGSKVLERPFFNINLESATDQRRVFGDANLSAMLKTGYNGLQGGQLQEYGLQRVAGLALADELHLPSPTSEQVAKYVTTLRMFQDQQGQFDNKRYADFADKLHSGTDDTTADVNRVMRDDTRLEVLSKIVGGPGYVLPTDVTQQLSRSEATWTVQVVTLDYASFNPAIPTPDDVLKKYFADNSFRYDVSARPRLSYVEFKGADFVPPVKPTEAELRNYYNANSANFPVPPEPADAKPAVAALDPAADKFPKVRAQVEAALIKAAGVHGASQAANDLSTAIYEHKFAANSPELTAYLTTLRRPAVPLAPFALDQPPADRAWLANYSEEITKLSPEHFFTDPLATGDGYAVLLWNESLAAYKPSFSEVHDRVVTDYKEAEKRKLFSARGQALHAQLQAGAKSPEEFAKVVAAEKLEVKSFPNFNLRQPPQDLPYQATSALQSLETGKVSDMLATEDKGYIVYAQEKKLPELTPSSPRYAEVQKQLMAYNSGANHNAYLTDRVERELKKTEPAKAQ